MQSDLLSVCHGRDLEQSSFHPAAGIEAGRNCRVANGLVGDTCEGEQSRREVKVESSGARKTAWPVVGRGSVGGRCERDRSMLSGVSTFLKYRFFGRITSLNRTEERPVSQSLLTRDVARGPELVGADADARVNGCGCD